MLLMGYWPTAKSKLFKVVLVIDISSYGLGIVYLKYVCNHCTQYNAYFEIMLVRWI